MAGDDENSRDTTAGNGQPSQTPDANSKETPFSEPPPAPTPALPPAQDRSALLDRARIFLTSPQIRHEEPVSKRRFLAEKGLNDGEIEMLMRELIYLDEKPHLPAVPPRTYPQPPPSNLPRLLLGLTKVLTWLTGGSAVLVLIYYKFLLPRITRSALARRALKQHQVALLTRLNDSLASLKTTQAETFAVLPPPIKSLEPVQFAAVHSLEDLNRQPDSALGDVPEFTLLRCAIEDLSADGKDATREELFGLLDERFSWLRSEKGAEYQNSLWDTLTTHAAFSEVDKGGQRVWTYTPEPPSSSPPTALISSLTALHSALPARPTAAPNTYQHTLNALTDLTGYITTQTYQLTTTGGLRMAGIGFGSAAHLGPQEEELRREIRALKGLVLNRRTFAPISLRPSVGLSQTS